MTLLRANGTLTLGAFHPPTVVGAVPIGDDSDDTWLDFDDDSTNTTVGIDTGTVSEPILLHLRMQVFVDDPEAFAGEGEIFLTHDAAGTDEFAGFSDGSVSGFGFALPAGVVDGIVEFTVPLRLGPWAPTTTADVIAALETGCFLDFNSWNWVGGSFPPTYRVYEAWIGEEGPRPVRQYPRDDGLGHSSAPRNYPPPKAARNVGGYQ
jgi:hypothetical protein